MLPLGFQSRCMDDDYWASCRVRGFSAVTIENDAGVLHRVLALLGLPAWEAAAEDVERVVGGTGGGRVGVVHSTGICAGVQGVSPVPAVAEGGRDRRVVRCPVGLPGG